ncbi:MAG: hypothetical protein COX07_07835 [Bacteroidetes bacterium CG23_combo_of_CG06-09_8_20_14_all_32_9]|nr:MAG: hypothetical protein COX07_07835 [Bacteroidetes bacterium CG23_combo_of_CG06-09_8_20_14_all_32_9]
MPMQKKITILVTCENTTSENLIYDVINLNDNFNDLDEILDKVSVDPPNYLVNRVINMIQEM